MASNKTIDQIKSHNEAHLKWVPKKRKSIITEVDIIVPFYGQYGYVVKLINSLWHSTRGIKYNVYLIDDCSPSENFSNTLGNKMKISNLFVIRHDEQKGFGASLNTGIKASKSPWIVLLNSDVSFESGNWLNALGETYVRLQSEKVVMVSSRMNNISLGDSRIVFNKGKVQDEVLCPLNIRDILEKDEFLPFVCVLTSRELFDKIGLIKEYPLGWYEDVEFACRLNKKGLKQGISNNSIVKHEDGITINSLCETDKKCRKIIESNFDLCCRDVGI